MKILGSNLDTKCMYCGAFTYGKGCLYGPKGLHIHTDDPKRCVWCGSTNHGLGCPFNPFGKMHQKGIGYNPVMIECIENGIIQGIVMKRLSESIEDTPAYRAGLIDVAGNTIREPETIEEKKILTGVDKYLIKVKNLMREKLEILNVSLYYEHKDIETVEELGRVYEAELNCKDEISECMGTLMNIMSRYSEKGLSGSKVEQMIMEAILNEKTD